MDIQTENQEQLQDLTPFDADFGERIADLVKVEVAKSLEGLDIGAEVAQSLAKLDIEALVHGELDKALSKIEHKVARARDRAHRTQEKVSRVQEKMQKAQEKARRAAERVARHAEKRSHRLDVQVAAEKQAGQDHASARPKASEAEQLSVLRMLQQGTITADQADMLLAALAA